MENKTVITGIVKNFIFEANDSTYKVVDVLLNDTDEECIVVGNFINLELDMCYEFVGEFKIHTKYGYQFIASSYSKSNVYTVNGLVNYLSSEKFVGIGPKLALQIVTKLGTDCITKIVEDRNSLNDIKGLTEKKADLLYETLKDNYLSEQIAIKLYEFGLTSKMILRLVEKYGLDASNKIEENPYRLIYEVDGFGFKKSDTLALKLGIELNDKRRIKAALIYTLNTVCMQYGFTYLTSEQLKNSTMNLLENDNLITNELYLESLNEIIEEKKIISDDDKLFDTLLYNSEIKIKERVLNINSVKSKYSKNEVTKALDYVETNSNFKYTELQREAIINSLSNKLSIITGGPGTGKSTILKAILEVYAKLNDISISDDIFSYKVNLMAPTGRAAKRMVEASGFKARTIHKSLEYNYLESFNRDEFNPLNIELLIVDEASMLDTILTARLFSAILNKCQVILIGDSDQLPSIQPGNVLYDLMNTNIFKTTKLNQIMRQASNSDIITLSRMVLNERIDYNIFNNRKEIFFYDRESKDALEGILKIYENFIKSGGDAFEDIQILAPMYAGPCGIDLINAEIQNKFNNNESKLVRDNKIFKIDDKVLQLKNDSELEIMNGDLGKVIDIIKEDNNEYLMIDFDSKIVKYSASKLDDLTLGYAISIHKSQGSEFKNVIMPIVPSYQIMLRKKIIYTAITRAKEKLIIIGKIESIEKGIHKEEYPRQTTLNYRLNQTKEISNKIYDKNIPFDTFGEYDMDGITPYDFMD